MTFVTVTVNIKTHAIVCVDGIFNDAGSAQQYADVQNTKWADGKYYTTVEVVTKPA